MAADKDDRDDVPTLTAEQIRESLRKSAKGADELHRLLEPCFRLDERSASLRLR